MITINGLEIHQGTFSMEQISFEVPAGQYGTLMGETGGGKTTLLEAICGLRPIASGTIHLFGKDVSRISPALRQIGYVPQDSVLIPTMRIAEQIEYPLRLREFSRVDREKKVLELADKLGISPLLGRMPKGLSGGEQKRVALARALSFSPRVLCLDEPLSGLDEATHRQLTDLLIEIRERRQTTVLHITHNSDEAKQIGTSHFELRDGTVRMLDSEAES